MSGTKETDELRRRIDAADDAILSALKGRFALMEEMRELKTREGLPRVDAEALAREMKEEAGVEVDVGALIGVVENSFLQHGERHCEINLVYEMKIRGASAAVPPVTSREEWIEFEWRDIDDLASANLLPAEMERFARGGKDLV